MSLAEAFADGDAFVPYLAAGDPSYEASLAYVEALERGGADVIELGLPFSEPIAEGPTIQQAVVRALEAGMTPDRFFEFVAELDVDVPLVCMTYYNLIYQYGRQPDDGGSPGGGSRGGGSPDGDSPVGDNPQADRGSSTPRKLSATGGPEAFVERAAAVGLDGFVVPDLPAEEAGPLREACDRHGLDLVFVVAPTTTDERLERMLARASGYLYVQARLGVTGAREDVSDHTRATLDRLAGVDLPTAVGFGISTGEQAADVVAAGADGVIVGSALVDVVAEGHETGRSVEETASRLEALARELKEGAVAGAQRRPRPERT